MSDLANNGRPTAASHCTIHCQKSNLQLEWTPTSPPLLDLLEQAGIRAAYSCRYGNCHTCVARIISGTVAHPEETTSPGDGQMLICCAAPLTATLVVDI